MTDINKLKALAEAASEFTEVGYEPVCVWDPAGSYRDATDADMSFLCAANPAAVLELIAEIERYRYVLRRVFKSTDGAFPVDGKWLVQIQTMKRVQEALCGSTESADSDGDLSYALILAERQQLKTENTDLHATLQAAKGEIERLKAENQALLDNPGDAL